MYFRFTFFAHVEKPSFVFLPQPLSEVNRNRPVGRVQAAYRVAFVLELM
jgi:hypothetical protein